MCQAVKECEPESDELYALKLPPGAYYTVKLLKDGQQMLKIKKPESVKPPVDVKA